MQLGRHGLMLGIMFALLLVPASWAQQEGPGGDPECIVFFSPSPDFTVVRVRADLVLDAEKRAALVAEIDTNEDGMLNATEVAAYESVNSQVLLKGDPALGDKRLAMDTVDAESTTFVTKLTDWVGPAASARNGTVTETRVYDFPQARASDEIHALSVGAYDRAAQNPPRPVIETVIFQAPPGWIIWSVTNATLREPTPAGMPSPTPIYLERDAGMKVGERTVELRGNETANGYHVLFAKEGVDPYGLLGEGNGFFPTPAPGVFGMLAAILVGVALMGPRARRD